MNANKLTLNSETLRYMNRADVVASDACPTNTCCTCMPTSGYPWVCQQTNIKP
jgi:hypothetical protein